MFEIKSSTGMTIVSFNEILDWEFSIDKTGYIDLLDGSDIAMNRIIGGKPVRQYATQERASEVVNEIVQAVMDSRFKHGEKFYILPDK